MEENRNACRILVGNLKDKEHVEGLDADWRIILKGS
jgi:hypothetical protein